MRPSERSPTACSQRQTLYELAAILLRPARKVPPDVWAAEHRIYPATAGIPGPRDPGLTPYGIPLGRAIQSGAYRRVVGVMGSQMGKTETLIDVIGARLDQRPAPILYVGPSKEFATDQFEPRLMELFDQAETLSLKLERGKKSKKTLKRVAGVRIRLAHAGSSTALKSDPAALALVDEYDEMLSNVRGQGDPLGLVEARGQTYADFVTAVTSTPSHGAVETEIDPASGLERWTKAETDDVGSPIWRLWQEGTRHEWAWPCPSCGSYFIPRFRHLKWPEGATSAEARARAFLCCPVSGCILEDDVDGLLKRSMNARGALVAPGQAIGPDGVVSGEPPPSSTWSMWVSGLASPFVTWGERAEAYLKAVESGETDKIQTAINAHFGECHSLGLGGSGRDWRDVAARKAPYVFGQTPREAIRLCAAVDVQKRSLFYVLRGFGARGGSWLIERGEILGATETDMPWEELRPRLLQTYDGMVVEKAFIDSGFRPDKGEAGDPHKVYDFCLSLEWLAVPTKGQSRPTAAPIRTGVIEVNTRGRRDPRKLQIAHLNTDYFKSLVFSRIALPHDSPGGFWLPTDIDEDYCRQIVSETRVLLPSGKPTWVRKSRQNHYLDCEAMVHAAGFSLGVHRLPDGMLRDWSETPAEGQPSASPPKPMTFAERMEALSAQANRR